MSGFTAVGIDKDTVTTTQQAPLGFRLTVPTANDGNQTYTYVKAAAAIGQGISCARGSVAGKAGYGAVVLALSSLANHRYVGAAQQTGGIPLNEYGFVLTQGVGDVVVQTLSAATDALVMHSATGRLDNATSAVGVPGNFDCGVVAGTAIGAGATGKAYVNFKG